MMRLDKSLQAWATPAFEQILKEEIGQLDARLLPLQEGLSHGSHANEDSFDVVVLGSSEEATRIRIKAGIFYTSIIAGCSCADDPTPVDELTEYCEVLFEIDKSTARATVSLLA